MTILSTDFRSCAAIPVTAERDVVGTVSDETPISPPFTSMTPESNPEKCSSGRKDSDALPDDARLYLRHVEGGESIRAIARDAGCHPSTILRRIRRFEQRRDDPLVDRAVERATGDAIEGQGGWTRHELDQARRVLRRLAEPRAVLAVAEGMEKAIVTRDDIRLAVLHRDLAERLALMGWVALSQGGRITRHVITQAGRAALKNMVAGRGRALPGTGDFADARPVGASESAAAADMHEMAEAPAAFSHAEQHRVWDDREIDDPDTGERRRARVNLAESPLLVLARRRDADGKPFLDAAMVAAGERLREDFELAQMGPRVTQNWDRFMTAGVDAPVHAAGYGGGSESARNRVAAALRDLGPGMGDLVLRVCCFLEGIEMTERRLGWSARSGKIVLRLALMRLDRHYRETYGFGAPLIG